MTGTRYKTPEDFIQRNIVIDSEGCWNWVKRLSFGYGEVHRNKYGQIYKCTKAHQLSYKIYKGEYEKGLSICHTCHNRCCVNPSHLYAGTHKENMQDMIRAGRKACTKGENSGVSKLTWKDVKEIRDLLRGGPFLQKEIAELYNVYPTNITKIKKGTRWSE